MTTSQKKFCLDNYVYNSILVHEWIHKIHEFFIDWLIMKLLTNYSLPFNVMESQKSVIGLV